MSTVFLWASSSQICVFECTGGSCYEFSNSSKCVIFNVFIIFSFQQFTSVFLYVQVDPVMKFPTIRNALFLISQLYSPSNNSQDFKNCTKLDNFPNYFSKNCIPNEKNSILFLGQGSITKEI